MDSIKLEPYTYIHIIDLNSNLTRLEEGPKTIYKLDQEEIVLNATKMIKLPPASCVTIGNPVLLDKDKKPIKNSDGTFKNKFGENKVKTSDEFPEPFPLYPGETLVTSAQKFQIVGKDEGLLIQVTRDYTDAQGRKHLAGEIYQAAGPLTYINRIEEKPIKTTKAITVTKNQGLILKALQNFTDRKQITRYTGESWLFTDIGSFLPDVNENIEKVVKGVVLDNKKAIHVQAKRDFTDALGQQRRAGEKWLITNDLTQTYIEGVNDQIVSEVKPVTLTSREYCIVENPYLNDKPQWGKTEIIIGEKTFFLQPNEKLIGTIQKISILDENDAIILEANDDFYDEEFKLHRTARENWMIKGPREYIPNIHADVKKTQKAIALDQNEGVYIRDLVTGEVRAVIGEKILLKVGLTF